MARRLARASSVLAVLLGAIAAPLAPGASAAPPPPGVDPRIVVVGDSVILGARDAVIGRLAGWQVTFEASVSLSTAGAVSVIDRHRSALGAITVVALGNNDGADPALLAARVDAVMGALPGAPVVVWVNLRTFRDWVQTANTVLAEAAARWPNLEIADWSEISSPRPDLVAGDGIHLGAAGAAAMAELVGAHVDAAAARLAAPPPTSTTTGPEVAAVRAGGASTESVAAGSVAAGSIANRPTTLADGIGWVAAALAPLAVLLVAVPLIGSSRTR